MGQPRVGDVYGALLADMFDGKRAQEIVERDDGFVMAFDGRYLLAPFREWDDANERRAMRLVRGQGSRRRLRWGSRLPASSGARG